MCALLCHVVSVRFALHFSHKFNEAHVDPPCWTGDLRGARHAELPYVEHMGGVNLAVI